MKSAFYADLLHLKGALLRMFLVILVVCALCVGGMFNAVGMVPIATITAFLTLFFTLPAIDEQNGWQAYRAALPLTRSSIVIGRALIIAATTAAATLFAVVLTVVFYLIATAFPHLGLSAEGIDAQGVALVAAVAFVSSSLLFALIMPFIAKFGLTKAMSFIPLAFLAVFLLVLWAVDSAGAMDMFYDLFERMLAGGVWPVVAGSFGIGIALYALGTALAARLYATRMF